LSFVHTVAYALRWAIPETSAVSSLKIRIRTAGFNTQKSPFCPHVYLCVSHVSWQPLFPHTTLTDWSY
jgi:hypothetical protein